MFLLWLEDEERSADASERAEAPGWIPGNGSIVSSLVIIAMCVRKLQLRKQ
jgi:hypothetical protein